jgi:hypothetical protein
LEFLESG